MVSVTGSGGTDDLSLNLWTIIEPMPPRRHRTPTALQESYAVVRKSIQDSLPILDELLQQPRDPEGKPRFQLAKSLRGKFQRFADELQGVQSELIEVLDRDLADAENEEDRVEKAEGLKEIVRSHREYLQGLESKREDLKFLMEEIQEIEDAEKAKVLLDEQFQREVNERERIWQENRMNEDRGAAQKRTQELEDAARRRTQDLEDVENRRKERREEADLQKQRDEVELQKRREDREHEMASQLSAQRRAMDLAKLTHPVVAAEILPTSSFKCKSGRPVKPPKLQLKSFFGDHLRWHEFWDSFSASIHNNIQLTAIGKFLDLKGLIRGEAEKVIEGFPLTEIHYKQAIH
ncbi:MAG: DUF1759 domain-containing protein, partial [Gammaproteobacteria bacterium]|nr:DUF1759 domain-containing protein [Gammaproteobacteria bacterium]